MEQFFKIAGCGIAAVILSVTVRNLNREFSVVIALCAAVIVCIAGSGLLKEAKKHLDDMQAQFAFDDDFLRPLLKVCIISSVSKFCGCFCKDAGEDALGKIIELWGSVAAACVMFPLIEALWKHISELLGG